MIPNSPEALLQRKTSGRLTWSGPAGMLLARTGCAVGAQAIVAAIFAARGSTTPWRDAEPWLPVYGALIDAGCLALLWCLTRREGIRLFDLVGWELTRPGRDVLLGLGIIPASLIFVLAGSVTTGWLLYGHAVPPVLFGGLPWLAVIYSVIVFPVLWGVAEQMTYSGYLLPRFQVLGGSTTVAVTIVSLIWALQHAFMPLTFDPRFMAFRFLASVPNSVLFALLYLRLRRLLPLIVAHAVMDGASVLMGVLPALRG